MRIHYTATIWHGGFCEFFGRALKSLGHEVIFFNESGTGAQAFFERIGTKIPKFSYEAEDIFRRSVSRDWLRSVRAAKPDLILLEHAPNILAEAIGEARKLGKPIFYWMDSPPAGAQAKDVLASLSCADRVFTIDRSWMTVLYGAGDFEYLPLAGEPEIFHPEKSSGTEAAYDVVFVGSLPPQSGDGYLRAKILAEIPSRYRVAVFGSGIEYWYRYFPSLASRAKVGRLSAAALNEVYNRSRVLLNIHSTWHSSSVSARTYEAALAGLFQLVDYRKDLDELFPEKPFGIFRSAKEIVPLLDEWLAPGKEKERAEVAGRAREVVLARHTWRHRAERMLGYLPAGSARARQS